MNKITLINKCRIISEDQQNKKNGAVAYQVVNIIPIKFVVITALQCTYDESNF